MSRPLPTSLVDRHMYRFRRLDKPSSLNLNIIAVMSQTGVKVAAPLPRRVLLDFTAPTQRIGRLQPFTSGKERAEPSWVLDTVAYK
jgi:hypothetical protein